MILIAFGANLPSRFGKPEDTLEVAKRTIESLGIRIVRSSGTWITAPVPISDQPWYRNAVVSVQTALAPEALMALLRAVEDDFGRIRGERNASRILDLDILAYGDLMLDAEGIVVPHPRMHERAFVLYPLREIAPDWRHPASGMDIERLILGLSAGQDIRLMETQAA